MISWVNEQTGSYTLQPQDNNRLIVFDSASAVTFTLPDQSAVDWIGGTFAASVANMGDGAVTISPSSSTIDGQSSLTLEQYEGIELHSNGSNYFTVRGMGTGGGSGGVTSVALTVPSRQSVSGSPVTSSGTLAITDNTQSANEVFAGPVSGSAAAPGFRSLVAADLPVATTSSLGAVQPDNATITISGGVISASGGGGGGGSSAVSFGTGNPNTTGGTATPVMVQHDVAGSTAVTMGSNVIEGDLLVVTVAVTPDPGSPTLSDTLSTSFTQIATKANGDNGAVYVFAGLATAGGANTITCSSSDCKAILAAEFSGTIATVDVSTTTTGGYGAPPSSNITTTKSNDLVFLACMGQFGGGTLTPSGPFTLLNNASSSVDLAAAYALQATAGSVTGQFTSTSNYWGQVLVAFEANPDGPLPGAEKDIYFDTTSSTYAGYVYHDTYWNPF
jgi:hypothetical protein